MQCFAASSELPSLAEELTRLWRGFHTEDNGQLPASDFRQQRGSIADLKRRLEAREAISCVDGQLLPLCKAVQRYTELTQRMAEAFCDTYKRYVVCQQWFEIIITKGVIDAYATTTSAFPVTTRQEAHDLRQRILANQRVDDHEIALAHSLFATGAKLLVSQSGADRDGLGDSGEQSFAAAMGLYPGLIQEPFSTVKAQALLALVRPLYQKKTGNKSTGNLELMRNLSCGRSCSQIWRGVVN